MRTTDLEDLPLGERLVARGWVQGAVFSAPSIYFATNTVADPGAADPALLASRLVKAKEQLVVVTQTCDIMASESEEPNVEALICTQEHKKEFLARIDRNSARWFVIDLHTGLVAQAKYRVQMAKQLVDRLEPGPWPSDPERLDRFVRWLGRRYDRPAIPDVLVKTFQKPVEEALARLDRERPELGAAFSRAVHELRVRMPSAEAPPFDLQILVLVRRGELSQEEADAIDAAMAMIRTSVDPTVVHLATEPDVLSDEDLTVKHYFATVPLFLEYLTYEGGEVRGVEPFGRA